MAKGGQSKLKCMIKRWHSSSRISCTPTSCSVRSHDGADAGFAPEDSWRRGVAPSSVDSIGGGGRGPRRCAPGLHPVHIGKSRLRYLINADLVSHPCSRNLDYWRGAADGGTVVGCEVVLFEHLLWMLENADPQQESLDELVEYYAC